MTRMGINSVKHLQDNTGSNVSGSNAIVSALAHICVRQGFCVYEALAHRDRVTCIQFRAASHYTISVVRRIRSHAICHDGSS